MKDFDGLLLFSTLCDLYKINPTKLMDTFMCVINMRFTNNEKEEMIKRLMENREDE